jgi:hypothetical protein
VYRVLPETFVYMFYRAFFGVFIVVGSYIQLWNVWKTVKGGDLDRELEEPSMNLRDVAPMEAGG